MPPKAHLLYIIISGIFGACIGSFLNVVIYRLPRDKSLVHPPSHCPKCNKIIRWFDNIPLLSYIVLGGKCRNCKENISLRYPMVEFLVAVLFVTLYAVDIIGVLGVKTGYPAFFIHCVFAAVIVAVTFIDFDLRIIPDELSLGGAAVALIVSTALPGEALPLMGFTSEWNPYLAGAVASLIGGFSGAGITWLTRFLGTLAFKKEAMGFGDVKLMLMIGCLLGWQAAVIVFFIAPFFGLMYGIPQMLLKKGNYVAYGPFLSMAALLYILFQPKILGFFYGIFNV